MKCAKCGFENADTAAFCSECGAALGYRCAKCGQPLQEGMKFCPRCGTRCDGKQVCPACGAVAESTARHCSECGRLLAGDAAAGAPPKAADTAVGAPPKAAAAAAAPARRPAKRKDKRAFALRILDYVRGGVVAALAIVVFICSFFGAFHIDIEIEEINGSFRVSTIDIIEGAFSCVDPMPEEERVRDFYAFVRDELPANTYGDLSDGSMSSAESEAILMDVMEKYNVLKIVTMKEIIDLAPNAAMSLGFLAFFAFAVILLSGAFLIVSIISLIYLVTGRRKCVRAATMLAVVTACAAVALTAMCGLVFDGRIAGCTLTVLLCSLLSALACAGYSVGAGEIAFDKRFLFSAVSAAVNAALIVTALALCVSSVLTVRFTVSDGLLANLGLTDIGGSRKFGYTVSDLMEAWSALRMAEDGSLEYGGAAAYYTEAAGQILVLPLYFAGALASPALAGVLGKMAGYENGLQVVGIFAFVIATLLIVTLCVSLCLSLADAARGYRACFLHTIPAAALVIVLLVLTIVYGVLVNGALDGVLEDVTYKASVSGAQIACVVMTLLTIVQAVVFRLLGRPQQPAAAAADASAGAVAYGMYNTDSAAYPAPPAEKAPAFPSDGQPADPDKPVV